MATNKSLVGDYLRLREFRASEKRRWEASDRNIEQALDKIEAEMAKRLRESESDSVRTELGTFYRQIDIKPRGEDWQAFYDWVAENGAFDALERRIKKPFIAEYMAQNDGAIPPGVTVLREYVVRVRKGD